MTPGPIIEVSGLTRVFRSYKKEPGLLGAIRGLFHRNYDQTTAVDAIRFSINEGECVGFVGPNGAGKTTTLKILSGLLHPTHGRASVLGYTPWERPMAYRRQFALLLGHKNQLWWDLPARESLELNAKIYGVSRRDFERRVSELTELLDVRGKLDIMVRELSLGERMKMELIAALLHQPKVLFLDEPTIGLDLISQQTVREFLRGYNRTFRTTILLTSHYMSDIEALCRRVIIIDQGKIFFDGTLEKVVDQFVSCKLVTVHLSNGSAPDAEDLNSFGQVLELVPGRLKLKVPRHHVISACKALLETFPVADIEIKDVSIEEVIRSIFSRSTEARSGLPSAVEMTQAAA